MERKWYAVYTKPRWEKKVAELLNKRKFDSYCPLNMTIRQWSDRKMKVWEPLFRSYVFVNTLEKELLQVKEINGILSIVHWLYKPAVIKDSEIEAIKNFLNEYKTVRLEKMKVNLNDKVRVLSGPLMEYEGSVFEIKNSSVKILLPSLGYMMVAEVEKSNVEIINYTSLRKNTIPGRYALR